MSILHITLVWHVWDEPLSSTCLTLFDQATAALDVRPSAHWRCCFLLSILGCKVSFFFVLWIMTCVVTCCNCVMKILEASSISSRLINSPGSWTTSHRRIQPWSQISSPRAPAKRWLWRWGKPKPELSHDICRPTDQDFFLDMLYSFICVLIKLLRS